MAKVVANPTNARMMDQDEPMPDDDKLLDGIDDVILAINFEWRRKLKAIKATEQKLQLSENDKIRIGAEYNLFRNTKRLINLFKKTINAHLGKMPPAAVDLEEAILGAAMLETKDLNLYTKNEAGQFVSVIDKISAINQIRTFLKAEHFYSEAHQLIYKAIIDLGDDPVDMRTVVNQLRSNGNIEIVGGAHYIAELTAKVSSAANIQYHARVVIEFAMKRSLINMASELMLNAYDDTEDAFKLLDFAIEKTNHIDQWRRK
jgi:hypothetical protein